MPFLQTLTSWRHRGTQIDSNQNPSDNLFGVQQWSYYRDLTISSEFTSIRYSCLYRSLYNLIYTPNDELDYFIVYMDSCSLSSYLKFIFDINAFDKISREKNSNDDLQTAALTLFHRYLSIDAKELVPINDDIRRTTLSLICPLSDSTKPDPDCFRMAREHIWEFIEQSAYPGYLQSIHHRNYQLKILTSDQFELHDILYHAPSLSYFIKFAEQENIIDLVRFWIDVEHFYQNIIKGNIDPKRLEENALDIYEQYISLQAPSKLGFDDAIRTRVECSICQIDTDAGPSIDTFDQTAWIVYVILQREYFSKFLQSIIFCQYINNLMVKLRQQDPVPQIKTLEFSKSPYCSKGRFSMGYIDPLGRFIRDPDIDSNRKMSSNPFHFLTQQFVRNEHDELDEIAARFAETFINEITNRTENPIFP